MGLVQYADNGLFAPRKIAEAFRTTSEEVARTAGLGKDAVQRKDRVRFGQDPAAAARDGRDHQQGRAAFRVGDDGLCLVSIGAAAGLFGA